MKIHALRRFQKYCPRPTVVVAAILVVQVLPLHVLRLPMLEV
jgi:hypothetical protein